MGLEDTSIYRLVYVYAVFFRLETMLLCRSVVSLSSVPFGRVFAFVVS